MPAGSLLEKNIKNSSREGPIQVEKELKVQGRKRYSYVSEKEKGLR